MASKYCYSIEMKRAVEGHEHKEARVIPVILRHIDWKAATFGKLQALPKDGKPVKSWPDQDEAFFNVAEGIRKVVMQLAPPSASPAVPEESQQELTKPSVLPHTIVCPPVPREREQQINIQRIPTPAVQQGWNVSRISPLLAVEKLALLYTLTGHTDRVLSIALSADGRTVVSGSADETIRVWNLSTGKELRIRRGHYIEQVNTVALSTDGQTLASGNNDWTIRVWRA